MGKAFFLESDGVIMKRLVFTIFGVLVVELMLITPLLFFTPFGRSVVSAVSPSSEPVLTLTASGTPPPNAAASAYLLDADSGQPLMNKHAALRLPMASTTKMMTALIVLEQGNLNQMVTVGDDAVKEAIGKSTANLHAGDRLRMQDLLYALILPSGNDAAVAIADGMSGSVPAFAKLMNERAQELQLNNTHYINPNGLTYLLANGQPNPNHYSTAEDLAHLARYAMQNPLFAQIVHSQEYMVPATSTHQAYDWKTTDKLLSTYAGVLGIKTGKSMQAGYCLVFEAYRNGHHLIGVLLHDGDIGGNADQLYVDAAALLDWGFQLPTTSVTP